MHVPMHVPNRDATTRTNRSGAAAHVAMTKWATARLAAVACCALTTTTMTLTTTTTTTTGACSPDGGASRPPARDDDRAREQDDRARIVLATPGGEVVVDVEVADDPAERARGLMFRNELPNGRGMLFILDDERVQSFWMMNTYVALDMVFINDARTVVGVVANAAPMTRDPRRVAPPSRFVLEVPAGFAAAHGVAAGTRVSFINVRAAGVR